MVIYSYKDLKVITLSVLGELPTLILAMIIVNFKYLGRKGSLALAYLVNSLLCIAVELIQDTGYVYTEIFFK
jgi:hypothetical protein